MAMVAAGIGVCFAPEFSAMLPGICHRPIADPEVVRQVFRLFSSRAETFHQPSQRLPGQSAITIGAREPGAIAPIDPFDPMTMLTQFEWQQAVARISPQTLYGEVTAMLLDPARARRCLRQH
jgi:hypothetical protein